VPARARVFPLKDNIPTDRFPVVTVAIIAICVAVFIWQQPSGFSTVNDKKVVEYGAIPYEITHPGKHCELTQAPSEIAPAASTTGVACTSGNPDNQPPTWMTIFTAMFMHGGFLHIIGNMLFLWIFGNNVEDSMGPLRFIAFYLLGGIAAAALQVAVSPDSTAPLIGASGAIAGVLGGYIVLYPRARVLTLVFIIFLVTLLELPAVVVLGLWFLQQIYFGAAGLAAPTGGAGGGVAYFAHIGGFAFGLIFIKLFAKRVKQIEPRIPVY
jgi:membrane associated rhomboid family serine protease